MGLIGGSDPRLADRDQGPDGGVHGPDNLAAENSDRPKRWEKIPGYCLLHGIGVRVAIHVRAARPDFDAVSLPGLGSEGERGGSREALRRVFLPARTGRDAGRAEPGSDGDHPGAVDE